MTDNVKDVRAWIASENSFLVMGQLRRLGLLTRDELKKAMGLSRPEWIAMMLEKTGLGPETKNESE